MYRKVSLVPTHTLISATTANLRKTHPKHMHNMHTGQQTNREMRMDAHPKAYARRHGNRSAEKEKKQKNGNERTKAKGTVIDFTSANALDRISGRRADGESDSAGLRVKINPGNQHSLCCAKGEIGGTRVTPVYRGNESNLRDWEGHQER